MNAIFYGCDGSSADAKMGGGYVENILISAAMLWRPKSGTFAKFRPPNHERLFLDSGGFSFHARAGEYPFTPQQLADLSQTLGATYTAVMDYPCEYDTNRSTHATNQERIDATITNTAACLDCAGPDWVTVVQGDTLPQYRLCAERIRAEGFETDPMAIGSICRRRAVGSTLDVLRTIAGEFPGRRLHGFGVDLRFIRDRRIRQILWSTDTQAWKMHRSGRQRFPACEADKLRNFDTYRRAIDRILAGDACQTDLLCDEVSA